MSYQPYEMFQSRVNEILMEKFQGKKMEDLPTWDWKAFWAEEPECADARRAVEYYLEDNKELKDEQGNSNRS